MLLHFHSSFFILSKCKILSYISLRRGQPLQKKFIALDKMSNIDRKRRFKKNRRFY